MMYIVNKPNAIRHVIRKSFKNMTTAFSEVSNSGPSSFIMNKIISQATPPYGASNDVYCSHITNIKEITLPEEYVATNGHMIGNQKIYTMFSIDYEHIKTTCTINVGSTKFQDHQLQPIFSIIFVISLFDVSVTMVSYEGFDEEFCIANNWDIIPPTEVYETHSGWEF